MHEAKYPIELHPSAARHKFCVDPTYNPTNLLWNRTPREEGRDKLTAESDWNQRFVHSPLFGN